MADLIFEADSFPSLMTRMYLAQTRIGLHPPPSTQSASDLPTHARGTIAYAATGINLHILESLASGPLREEDHATIEVRATQWEYTETKEGVGVHIIHMWLMRSTSSEMKRL